MKMLKEFEDLRQGDDEGRRFQTEQLSDTDACDAALESNTAEHSRDL